MAGEIPRGREIPGVAYGHYRTPWTDPLPSYTHAGNPVESSTRPHCVPLAHPPLVPAKPRASMITPVKVAGIVAPLIWGLTSATKGRHVGIRGRE